MIEYPCPASSHPAPYITMEGCHYWLLLCNNNLVVGGKGTSLWWMVVITVYCCVALSFSRETRGCRLTVTGIRMGLLVWLLVGAVGGGDTSRTRVESSVGTAGDTHHHLDIRLVVVGIHNLNSSMASYLEGCAI